MKNRFVELVNSTVQDTSIKEDIGYERSWVSLIVYIERDIHWEDMTRLDVIGLDEISLKKGHGILSQSSQGILRQKQSFWGCC